MQWLVVTVCLYAGLANARTEEDQSLAANSSGASGAFYDQCFYRPASDCPEAKDCHCKRISDVNDNPEHNAILCCNVNNATLEQGLSCTGTNNTVTHIHIRNATIDTIFADDKRWRSLKSLAITDGSVKHVKEQFMMMTPLVCLNLSNNGLVDIADNSLNRLNQLTTLDLSNNKLLDLPNLNSIKDRVFWLDIAGTDTIWCQNIYEYINKTVQKQIKFNREPETVCSTNKTWHWFNTTEHLWLSQLRYINSLQPDCPKGDSWQCKCDVNRLDIVLGKTPMLTVTVDCSSIQLSELPQKLPRNTTSLNVSDNNITVLDDLSNNPYYEDIRVFLADNNKISSINKLEGSKFLDNYDMLSLRFNKIKTLPGYILAPYTHGKTFSSNRHVMLGGNKLHCDCNTAKSVKVWLQTRIMDYDEVLCENVREKVIDLEQARMCVYPGDWTDYIYYIIALEIILLFSLVAKVSYDYWVFKTAGYLPWPANKMPKLPCDWLCET
ncbi:protein halfway isoform X2 [Neodiprion pinetum]|nr:protein halfway isoform X2 [Neodiprion lecontei]XP_046427472.1 protein halfway isoform X2 [Neodiprion fabricii]XP_046427473.1 protein halfway isoform X2 [Neodiprion fabricii]XP_046481900.1 protein halfway isoform X2 [Neodiprion pinetum]XP_046481901.1 protein halfway isoform X2 [Neodiprion pinetum]XP_046596945.1 protein halfway isoform X2 [Neodiprion lecontei]XP_046596946.1 protein halfway isoform X2 [Neodiprion lecontei]XP_046623094.1 protein halfway isoform X2 [Neodiprion virginianus]XP